MQLAYYLEDNKGNKHRVDKDIYVEFTEKRIPLSSLNAGYGVFYKGTGKRSGILLHRYVSGAKRGEVVDHINRNVFDSRRRNLRKGSNSDNVRNQAPRGETGYKGVVQHHSGYAVYSKCMQTGRNRNLGSFRTVQVAARVWDAYQLAHFVHVPYLNFEDSTADYVPPPAQRCNGKRKSEAKYKGVRIFPDHYKGQVTFQGKVSYLGRFATEKEAARAYDSFLRAKGVPEWKLNFPERHPEKGRKAARARRK